MGKNDSRRLFLIVSQGKYMIARNKGEGWSWMTYQLSKNKEIVERYKYRLPSHLRDLLAKVEWYEMPAKCPRCTQVIYRYVYGPYDNLIRTDKPLHECFEGEE